MKKHLLFIPLFLIVLTAAYSQNAEDTVSQMDAAVRVLAQDLNRSLVQERAERLSIGRFIHRGNITPLGDYWNNQLSHELTNIPGRTFTLHTGGQTDWTITGEIVIIAETVRVYARLLRSDIQAIEAAFISDLERNQYLNQMIMSGGSGGGDSSWDFPILAEIGDSPNFPVINRTLNADGNDFFLLMPGQSGQLTIETTGNTDTYMEFYDASTRELLEENDDGGLNINARIRYGVEAGQSYIVMIRGYGPSTSGPYGFRAFFAPPRENVGSWENPINYELGFNENSTLLLDCEIPENGDEDFFLLVPDRNGRITIETTGNTDTYMYLYNYDTRELLDENDDGGQNYNARIRHFVHSGIRYLVKIIGYGSYTTGPYGFRAYLPNPADLVPDEYEPNDDPFSAGWIEIGVSQTHNFHHADDVDWVKFEVTQPGRYVIRTRGVDSNRLDTFIELFDENLNMITEDDDGGEYRDSRIALRLERGIYFLKVWCLDEEPDQAYTITISGQ